jgi:hypothetical protein
MKFLNGLKTIIGLAGTVVAIALPRISPDVVSAVGDGLYHIGAGVFSTLAALGIVHKVEKATQQ